MLACMASINPLVPFFTIKRKLHQTRKVVSSRILADICNCQIKVVALPIGITQNLVIDQLGSPIV